MLYLYMTYALAQSMTAQAPDWFGTEPVQRSLRLWLYTNSCISLGFLAFAAVRSRLRGRGGRRAACWLMALLGLAAILLAGSNLGSTGFLAVMAVMMVSVGYFCGSAHYAAVMRVKEWWRGRFLGASLTLTVLVQFVLSSGGKEVPTAMLLGVLALTVGLCRQCFRVEADGSCLEDDADFSEQERDERYSPPAPQFVVMLVLLVTMLAVLHGCGDSMALAFYSKYEGSLFHGTERLFFPLGILAAGCLADYRQRRYLLSATALMMLLRIVNLFFTDSEETFFLSQCAEYFMDSFCIMCYVLYFMDLAPRMRQPALWAGMGRTLALPVTAISANLFGAVLQDFSMQGFVIVYVLVLGLFNLFFYQESFREWLEIPVWERQPVPVAEAASTGAVQMEMPQDKVNGTEEAGTVEPGALPGSEPVGRTASPDCMEAYQQRFAFTAREMEVLKEILSEEKAAEIAVRLGIKERTVRYHIANILRKTGTKHRAELQLLLRMLPAEGEAVTSRQK